MKWQYEHHIGLIMNNLKTFVCIVLSLSVFLQGCTTSLERINKESRITDSHCVTGKRFLSESQLIKEKHGYYTDDLNAYLCGIESYNLAYLAHSPDDDKKLVYVKDNSSFYDDYSNGLETGAKVVLSVALIGLAYVVLREISEIEGYSGNYGYRYEWDYFYRNGRYVKACRDIWTGRFANNYMCY